MANLHGKHCNKYLCWGAKHEKGFKETDCQFLHPKLCKKSLDLECLDLNCPTKLHTMKCKQNKIGAAKAKSAGKNLAGVLVRVKKNPPDEALLAEMEVMSGGEDLLTEEEQIGRLFLFGGHRSHRVYRA